jgi:hypothetical protein
LVPAGGRLGSAIQSAMRVTLQTSAVRTCPCAFRQASVAGSTQAAGADAPGEGGFDPGADRVPASLLINVLELPGKPIDVVVADQVEFLTRHLLNN